MRYGEEVHRAEWRGPRLTGRLLFGPAIGFWSFRRVSAMVTGSSSFGGCAMADSDRKSERGRFAIFRAKDARCDADTTIMQYEPVSAVVAEGSGERRRKGQTTVTTSEYCFRYPASAWSTCGSKAAFRCRGTHTMSIAFITSSAARC